MTKRRIISIFGALLLIVGGAYAWLVYSPPPAPPTYQLTRSTIVAGGRTRYYSAFIPGNAARPLPLLLAFHGSGGNAATIRRRTGYRLEALAKREGIAVVYPDGVGGYWNGCRANAGHLANRENVDDVGFVRALVKTLTDAGLADPDRVYATGFSNGGHMAYRLALELPETVSGIAAIAASMPADDNFGCRRSGTAVAVAIVNGTRDPINPYTGGEVSFFGFGSLGNVLSSEESAVYFRTVHATDRLRQFQLTSGPVFAEATEWRRDGAPRVALVTVHNGGHTIPQAAYRFPRLLGPTLESDAVWDYLWKFLGRSSGDS